MLERDNSRSASKLRKLAEIDDNQNGGGDNTRLLGALSARKDVDT